MTLTLSPPELEELTGRKRSGAQRRALERMGIVFLVSPDGAPRVLRSHVERIMGSEGAILPEPELELCLESPKKVRPTSPAVRVLQARRILAR